MIEKIPRRIIQTEKSRDLPLLAKAAVTNLRLLNPNLSTCFSMTSKSKNSLTKSFLNIGRCSTRSPYGIQRYDFSGISQSIV